MSGAAPHLSAYLNSVNLQSTVMDKLDGMEKDRVTTMSFNVDRSKDGVGFGQRRQFVGFRRQDQKPVGQGGESFASQNQCATQLPSLLLSGIH